MNALDLKFADNNFDYVMAFHVVTVVPDPVKLIEEAKRVCKPGGKIVVVNHFTSTSPVFGFLTEALDPVTRYLGWSTKLKMKPFIEEARLKIDEVYKLSKLSLHSVLIGTND
jgi:phosphatidylethanolamine/phosphatidyl-N-methylethanolamine N-methyltransferase